MSYGVTDIWVGENVPEGERKDDWFCARVSVQSSPQIWSIPLWVKSHSANNGPGRKDIPFVTDLDVRYNDDAGPEGWIRAGGDYNPQGTKRSHVWMRKEQWHENIDPLHSIRIDIFKSDAYYTAAFSQKIPRCLNPGAPVGHEKIFLTFTHWNEFARHQRRDWRVGDLCDAYDTAKVWRNAEIVAVSEELFRIHYIGWESQWDVNFDRNSHLLDLHTCKTDGKWTGKGPQPWNLDEHIEELEEVIEKIKHLDEQKELQAEDVQYLTQGENRSMMQQILHANVEDAERMVPVVQNYLQANLQLISKTLQPGAVCFPEVVEGLVFIFSPDNQIYSLGINDEADEDTYATMPTKGLISGLKATVGLGERPTVSAYLVNNINFFGRSKGFDYAAERLLQPEKDSSDGSFTTISSVISVLAQLSEKIPFNKKWFEGYVKKLELQELFSTTIKSLSDTELKTNDQHALEEYLAHTKKLLLTIMKENQVQEFGEKSRLDIALRLLNSTVLREQITALNTLASVIKAVNLATFPELAKKEEEENAKKAKDPYVSPWVRRGAPRAPPPVIKAKFLKPEYLVTWIEENKLVQRILDKKNHEQIVKESTPVLKFLALNKALNTEHIDLLWDALASGHGSLRRIIYDTLAQITDELEEKQIDILYDRIKTLPIEEYKDFNLSFLRDFTVNAVHATAGKKKWYGLSVFWEIIQDQHAGKIDKSVSALSESCLRHCLEHEVFASQRTHFFQLAVEGLRQNNSVVQCLHLIRFLLGLYEKSDKAILQFDSEYHLLDLLFLNLRLYSEAALKKKAELETKKGGAEKLAKKLQSKEGVVLVPPHTHAVQIEARMTFLESLLAQSSLSLNEDNLKSLWSVLVDHTVGVNDTEILLSFLVRGVQGKRTRATKAEAKNKEAIYETFSEDIANKVFVEYLCKSDPRKLTQQWYTCFQNYFLELNLKRESISTAHPTWLFVNDDKKLVGLHALWSYATKAADSDVRAGAASFLVSCSTRLGSGYSSEEKRATFAQYMTRCISELAATQELAKKSQPDSEEWQQARNTSAALAQLLVQFLNRIDSGEAWKKPLWELNEPVMAMWTNQSIYRGSIKKVNLDGTYYVQFDDGDKLPAVKERNIFDLQRQARRHVLSEEDASDQRFPKEWLSKKDDAFALFFELLGMGGDVAACTWELLQFLPKNRGMQSKLQSLISSESVDWKDVLPSDSAPKLLYTMEIVDQYIAIPRPPEKRENKQGKLVYNSAELERYDQLKQDVAVFRGHFVKKGGIKYLVSFVTEKSTSSLISQSLSRRALKLVLEILKQFLDKRAALQGSQVLQEVDSKKFSGRLVELLSMYSDMTFQNDEEELLNSELLSYTLQLLRIISLMDLHLLKTTLGLPFWKEFLQKGFNHQSSFYKAQLGRQLASFCHKAAEADTERAREAAKAKEQYESWPALEALFLPILFEEVLKMTVSPAPAQNEQKNEDSSHSVSTPHSVRSSELFCVLRDILSELEAGKAEKLVDIEPHKVASTLRSLIIHHPILETSAKTEDKALVGLYGLCSQVLTGMPRVSEVLSKDSSFIAIILEDLFKYPSMEEFGSNEAQFPRAKSSKARSAAALLVQYLSSTSDVQAQVTRQLLTNHSSGPASEFEYDEWEREVGEAKGVAQEARTGYVGLKNLGCICYMNASMQQMFMIPQLRKNILSIDEYKFPEDLKNDNIYQLQYVMSHLQESNKIFVNPKPWTDIWMDETGKQPINVGRQEDADAYVNKCIDRIGEMIKKNPRHQDAFRQVMGGVYEHQLIGQGDCPHCKISRDEEFFTVHAEVQNMKTLADSLKSFVEGEEIDGYNCEECQKKVRVKKRAVIKKLPATLCITLKRFVLDFTTFQTKKLDDKIEFPFVLDIKPFTADALPLPNPESEGKDDNEGKAPESSPGLERQSSSSSQPPGASDRPDLDRQASVESVAGPPAEYYMYRLKGVVIHTGSANSGHYYSFIQERLVSEDGKYVPGGWFKFNDTLVTAWDPQNISSECFGGGKGEKGFGGTANGYLLFYDRMDLEHPATHKVLGPGVEAVRDMTDLVGQPCRRTRFKVPSLINQDIYLQSQNQWKNTVFYSESYFLMINQFLSVVKKMPYEDIKDLNEVDLNKPTSSYDATTRMGTIFFLTTLARSKNHSRFVPSIGRSLEELYRDNKASSCWLLNEVATQEKRLLLQFLLKNPHKGTRQVFANLIGIALGNIAPLEKDSWKQQAQSEALQDMPKNEGEGKQPAPEPSAAAIVVRADSRGYCIGVLNMFFRFLQLLPQFWPNFEQFFTVLAQAAQLGPEVIHLCMEHELLAKLLDLYFWHFSPDPSVLQRSNTRARIPLENVQTGEVANMEKLIVVVHELLHHVLQTTTIEGLSELSKTFLRAKMMYLTPYFEARDNRTRKTAITEIYKLLCSNDQQCFDMLVSCQAQWLPQLHYQQMRPIWRVFDAILSLEVGPYDKKTRTDRLLMGMYAILFSRKEEHRTSYKVVDLCIEMTLRQAKKNREVFEWLRSNERVLQLMFQFTQEPAKFVTIRSRPHQAEKYMPYTRDCTISSAPDGHVTWNKWYKFTTSSPHRSHYTDDKTKLKQIQQIQDNDYDGLDRPVEGYDSDDEREHHLYKVGDEIDVFDPEQNWLAATVTRIVHNAPGQYVEIDYDSYERGKYAEILSSSSAKIAPRNSLSQYGKRQR